MGEETGFKNCKKDGTGGRVGGWTPSWLNSKGGAPGGGTKAIKRKSRTGGCIEGVEKEGLASQGCFDIKRLPKTQNRNGGG